MRQSHKMLRRLAALALGPSSVNKSQLQRIFNLQTGCAFRRTSSSSVFDLNVESGTQSRFSTASNAASTCGDFNYRAFEDQLFESLSDGRDVVPMSRILRELKDAGLRRTDARLAESMARILRLTAATTADPAAGGEVYVDRAGLRSLLADNIVLLRRAFTGDLVIRDFPRFSAAIDELYWVCRANTSGRASTYLPELARHDAAIGAVDRWAVALCTVDGQRHAIGDVMEPFAVQSGGRPINYALAITALGDDVVREYVGQEPSGEPPLAGTVRLDAAGRPQNSLVSAGAVVVTSLLWPDRSLDERLEAVIANYRRLAGGGDVSFNNAMFLAEREIADQSYAIGYFLRHHKCLPAGVDLHETLDLYFQLCATEITADSGAVIAATLANGGYCPTTGEQVLSPVSVRNTLSLMHSCGMYDYSGGFAFKVGLPGKSGVSGIVLLVVPNVLGVCLWSPALDSLGNSVRGVQFCERFVRQFNFHHYDSPRTTMMTTTSDATSRAQPLHSNHDPRLRAAGARGGRTVRLLFAAHAGDATALRAMALAGVDMSAADYDGRTALHVAAAEGHAHCVRFLLDKCNVAAMPRDRWGQTPLDDAMLSGQAQVADYLRQHYANTASSDTVHHDGSEGHDTGKLV